MTNAEYRIKLERDCYKVIEDIQEAIVQAGGCFKRKAEIEGMTIKGFLETVIPNSIVVRVRHGECNTDKEAIQYKEKIIDLERWREEAIQQNKKWDEVRDHLKRNNLIKVGEDYPTKVLEHLRLRTHVHKYL